MEWIFTSTEIQICLVTYYFCIYIFQWYNSHTNLIHSINILKQDLFFISRKIRKENLCLFIFLCILQMSLCLGAMGKLINLCYSTNLCNIYVMISMILSLERAYIVGVFKVCLSCQLGSFNITLLVDLIIDGIIEAFSAILYILRSFNTSGMSGLADQCRFINWRLWVWALLGYSSRPK